MQILVFPCISRKGTKKNQNPKHLIAIRFGAKAAGFLPFVGLALLVVVQASVCSSRHTDNSFNLAKGFYLSCIEYSTCTPPIFMLYDHLCRYKTSWRCINHKNFPNQEVGVLLALKVFLKVCFIQILELTLTKCLQGIRDFPKACPTLQ